MLKFDIFNVFTLFELWLAISINTFERMKKYLLSHQVKNVRKRKKAKEISIFFARNFHWNMFDFSLSFFFENLFCQLIYLMVMHNDIHTCRFLVVKYKDEMLKFVIIIQMVSIKF